jgi:pyruvate kinase
VWSNVYFIVISFIQHGKSEKEIKSEIETEQMAVFILSSIEGALALT